jgi:hypothetical protein
VRPRAHERPKRHRHGAMGTSKPAGCNVPIYRLLGGSVRDFSQGCMPGLAGIARFMRWLRRRRGGKGRDLRPLR